MKRLPKVNPLFNSLHLILVEVVHVDIAFTSNELLFCIYYFSSLGYTTPRIICILTMRKKLVSIPIYFDMKIDRNEIARKGKPHLWK